MWDAPQDGGPVDGKIDRIDNGVLAVAVDAGKGEHPVSATFVEHRVGDEAASAPAADPGSMR